MSFQFRFETLLSFRQNLKEKAEVDLFRAQRRLRECQILEKTYRENLQLAHQELGVDIKSTISSDRLINHADYIAALKSKIDLQQMETTRLEKIVKEMQ